jgi:hypothetical protein
VSALVVNGSSIYAGGFFSEYKGSGAGTVNHIAKLDKSSGALDTTFSPATNGFSLFVLELATDGTSLYVGGPFTAYKGVANSANRIAKLNLSSGAIDTTFSPVGATFNGFDQPINAFAFNGSQLFVGLTNNGTTYYKGVCCPRTGDRDQLKV